MQQTIRKIRKIEKEQQHRLEQTELEASGIIAQAEKEALLLRSQAEGKAEKEAQKILRAAEEASENNLSQMRRKRMEEIDILIAKAKKNFQQALEGILRSM